MTHLPLCLQDRELQEARLVPFKIGGPRHAIGCLLQPLRSRQFIAVVVAVLPERAVFQRRLCAPVDVVVGVRVQMLNVKMRYSLSFLMRGYIGVCLTAIKY